MTGGNRKEEHWKMKYYCPKESSYALVNQN